MIMKKTGLAVFFAALMSVLGLTSWCLVCIFDLSV